MNWRIGSIKKAVYYLDGRENLPIIHVSLKRSSAGGVHQGVKDGVREDERGRGGRPLAALGVAEGTIIKRLERLLRGDLAQAE